MASCTCSLFLDAPRRKLLMASFFLASFYWLRKVTPGVQEGALGKGAGTEERGAGPPIRNKMLAHPETGAQVAASPDWGP